MDNIIKKEVINITRLGWKRIISISGDIIRHLTVPDHDVGYHGVAQRVDAVGDHSLKQLAQLEERGGDGGAHLKVDWNVERSTFVVFCLKFSGGMTQRIVLNDKFTSSIQILNNKSSHLPNF